MIESYFAFVDALRLKLAAMGELIDDTAAYVNTALGMRQNQLIQLQTVLMVMASVVYMYALIASIFGMVRSAAHICVPLKSWGLPRSNVRFPRGALRQNLTPLWLYYREDVFDQVCPPGQLSTRRRVDGESCFVLLVSK